MKKSSFASILASLLFCLAFTFPAFAEPQVVLGPIHNPATGNDYYLLSQSSWIDAQAKALTLGGNLVTINDSVENAWVSQTFGAVIPGIQGLWIGLSDAAKEGVFTWVNGEPVTFTNWESGQPDNLGDENYVHMWSSQEPTRQAGVWNDFYNSSYLKNSGVVEIIFPKNIQSLEITGPDQVAENSSASYKAIAHFDDGSTGDVTSAAAWSVAPAGFASVDTKGLLTTNDIEKFQNLTLTASYTHQSTTVEDQKAVTIFAICPTGSALQFDGQNDYVDLPDGFADFTNGLTIMVWAFPENTGHWGRLIEFGNGSQNNNILFARDGSTTRLAFEVYNGSSSGGLIRADQAIEQNIWQHFSVTLDSTGNVVMYKNGQIIKTGKTAIPQNIIRTMNYMAKSNWSSDGFYGGFMDDVRVYNRPLTPEEIQTGMNQYPDYTDINLIAYWNFDEGSGQTANDATGAYNGQLGATAGSDISDPLWVASDAPVGICTPYVVAVQNIKSALQKKLKTLEVIDAALENEQKAMDAVVEFLLDKDFGALKPMDILKAKLEIRLAMQKEINAQNDLRKSIQHLERSLLLLGVEIEPHQWPGIPALKSCNPADINQDGKVGTADLLLLRQNWLKTE